MRIGTVKGPVWATRKAPCLTGQTLLVVQTGTETLVASDLVGAGPGDRVLLAQGSSARLSTPEAPIDAAVVAILDQTEGSHVRT